MAIKNKLTIDELDYAISQINNWYKKDTKTLTVTSVPFNSTLIFGEIIHCYLKENKKVLYVWGISREDRGLVGRLKDLNGKFTYSYIHGGASETNLTFVTLENFINVRGHYDLIIYDDLSAYSKLTKKHIKSKTEMLHKLGDRVIYYLLDPITPLGDRIEVASIFRSKPFVEPRVITTRINLSEDIPYLLYDYLKWFKSEETKVIIYVPTEEQLGVSYDYYKNKLNLKGVKFIKYSKRENKKALKDVLKYKDKSIFIITNAIEESLEGTSIINCVILFADEESFNYKRLIFICGEIGRENENLPEVILVSNSENEIIEQVKSKAREFNKKIWDRRLLNL